MTDSYQKTDAARATAGQVPPQPKGFSGRASMSDAMIGRLREEGRPAFIGYLPYGFPDPQTSLQALRVMVDNGVDAVEIGLPYSDPVMDGPVIQTASQIALDAGERLDGVFRAVETVAEAGGVPLVMTYWNLVFHHGVERFASQLENAGGAGLITPDLIPDEAGEWIEASDRHGLDRVFLASPDSADERLGAVGRDVRGVVYAASRMGDAGARNVCVGIGVSTPEQAAEVGSYADGVIVGSALVHTLLDDTGRAARADREAMDRLAAKAASIAEGVRDARRSGSRS